MALKLVRPELLLFSGARARFQREVEAVARLQHVGIVTIHSVGEAEGIPYFAMERLPGRTFAELVEVVRDRAPESLSAHDLRQALARDHDGGAAKRNDVFEGSWADACVRLVRQVSQALQHAHERGIVHRDVKPSNVMVTPSGRAVLLDFGLTMDGGDARLTRTGAQMGTPAYMSPEQISGGAEVDRRADVYGLGVTLYELLTMQLPFQGDTPFEMQGRILGGRPDPMRARNRRVSAELETVVMKAMDADRARRYPDCAALADDLSNLLERRPIQARPPGMSLRLRRWSQRHPAVTTGIVAAAILLIGTPTAMIIQAWNHTAELKVALDDASTERDRARAENRTSQATLEFVLDLFAGTSPDEARGRSLTALDLLDRAARRLEKSLLDEPYVRARILLSLGIINNDLEKYENASKVLDESRELLDQDPDAEHAIYRARALIQAGRALLGLGDATKGGDLLARARALLETVKGAEAGDHAEVLSLLGSVSMAQQRWKEAEAVLREALDLAEHEGVGTEQLAVARANLGSVLGELGRGEEAAAMLGRAVADLKRVHEGPHPYVAHVTNNLGHALKRLGRLDEADVQYRASLAMCEKLWGSKSPSLAIALINYSALQQARKDLPGAERTLRRALGILEATDPGQTKRESVVCRSSLARTILQQGRPAEAEPLFNELLAVQLKAVGAGHPAVGQTHWFLGLCRNAAGDAAGAREHVATAARLLRAHTQHVPMAVKCLTFLAGISDQKAARTVLDDALKLAQSLAPSHDLTLEVLDLLIRHCQDTGDAAAADRYRKLRQAGGG